MTDAVTHAHSQDDLRLAWSTERTAQALSVTKNWLEQMRVKGNGPPYVKIGRRVVYRPADVSAWIAGKVRTNTSQEA